MKACSAEDVRKFDAAAIAAGIPGIVLMNTAGRAAVDELLAFAGKNRPFRIICGRGNNAGDGFVIASELIGHGVPADQVQVHCIADPGTLSGDARIAFENMPACVREKISFGPDFSGDCVLVDALLGTGITGVPRAPYDQWIRAVNEAHLPVFSIDIPSGLDAENGSAPGDVVQADRTVTFAAVKTGLITGQGPRYAGKIIVRDIGIPPEIMSHAEKCMEITAGPDAAELFVQLKMAGDIHKFRRGNVLVIGGSAAYPSAPFLTAEAALRAGAGLVTAVIPASAEIICAVPRALIVRRAPDSGRGFFCPESLAAIAADKYGVIAIGPGLGRAPETMQFLRCLLENCGKNIPCVMDADALNLIAEDISLLALLPEKCILTPHPGEAGRLLSALGKTPADPVADSCAVAAASGAVTAYKAARTVVADPDGEFAVNLSGSPALATAGSGDVLTGIAAGFLAQNMSAFNAARLAVWVHGMAGETAAKINRQNFPAGVIADDLLNVLPDVFRQLC